MDDLILLDQKVSVKEMLKIIALAVIASFIIELTVVSIMRVKGTSMQPTLYEGNRVVVQKNAYLFKEPQYGDIIILKEEDGTKLIKRVIGKPGDTLMSSHGFVIRNGENLDEPYIKRKGFTGIAVTTVEKNHYFVLGDNRVASLDSRALGTFDKSQIIGKVVYIIGERSD